MVNLNLKVAEFIVQTAVIVSEAAICMADHGITAYYHQEEELTFANPLQKNDKYSIMFFLTG
jgi:hypothetical protein